MPIIKSAKKRVKVSAKAAARNAKTKRTLCEAVKSFQIALEIDVVVLFSVSLLFYGSRV